MKTRIRHRVGIVLCLVLGLTAPGVASEEPENPALFEPEPDVTAISPMAGAVLRSRLIEPRLDTIRHAAVLRLPLFGDANFVARQGRVEVRDPDQFTWFGTIDGESMSLVVMSVHHGTLFGHIRLPGALYSIRRVGDTYHEIRQIAPQSFAPEAEAVPVPAGTNEPAYAGSTDADTGEIIDLIVVYTQDTAAASPDIDGEIQTAVDTANQIYLDSGAQQQLRLLHTQQVEYVETGDSQTDLYRLQDPADGYMDEVHPLRDAYCADTVQLWNEGMEACGRAYILTDPNDPLADYAYSVVWRQCAIDGYTLAHELGHNMGGKHDRIHHPTPGAFEYSHGYLHINGWRTVMGVLFGERIPFFSNPDILYGGVPIGVPEGDPESADMRKTLLNTASWVANFRDSGACAMAVPAPTVGVDRGAGADVTVSWGTACGAAWDYTIYGGELDTLRAGGAYTHESIVCSDIGGDLTETFTPGAGNRYFLVVPRDEPGVEGGYGTGRPQGDDTAGCAITGQRPGECP